MFTGIITDMGEITAVEKGAGDTKFWIKTAYDLDEVEIGASIAHAGCCLTVIEKDGDTYAVEVSNESFEKTTLGAWEVGTRINLERSLKMGDELGGHIVSGHVDGVAEIVSVTPEDGSHRLKIKVPQVFKGFIASKGSIALDGISLTVNEVEDDVFGVNIIPHTWDMTTLGQAQVGTKLNFEIDMLARYMARMLEVRNAA